jgi:ATP-dependent helicase/nuclease subunit B
LRHFTNLHRQVLLAISASPPEIMDASGASGAEAPEAGDAGDAGEAEQDARKDAINDASKAETSKGAAPDDASSSLWEGEDGQTLRVFFEGLLEQERPARTNAREYAGLYKSLMQEQIVRIRRPVHQRLSIWGPMEARMLSADIVILGALNEGTWPQPADADAWLSRPMRKAVGLPAPERRIGRSAHDFASVLGAKKIYMTRATRIDGAPSVPSRWLLRLEAICRGAGLEKELRSPLDENEPDWLALARQRNMAQKYAPRLARPCPSPPVEARPRRMAVTRVEQWIANPYAIFAGQILGLAQLPPLGREPDAALRGQIVHAALHEFSRLYPGELPADCAGELTRLANERMDSLGSHPRIEAFWKIQFERFAGWFAETEPGRRAAMRRQLTEKEGRLEISTAMEPFVLSARADRIDLQDDGSVIIYDYKSGMRKASDVRSLRSPQLPLEAAIAMNGGFADLAKSEARDLVYISITGREERGVETSCANADMSAGEMARQALSGLSQLIGLYQRKETPYPALRRHGFDYRFDEFEHLARVREWVVEED